MSRGDIRRIREENLRLGAAVAEIEGLYTALLRTSRPGRRRRLLQELARAGERLARQGGTLPGASSAAASPVPSRRERRQALAERGAAWIISRYGPRSRDTRR